MSYDGDIGVFEVTKENKDALVRLATTFYMEDVCQLCGKTFTFEEVEDSVYMPWSMGRIAHRKCWNDWLKRGEE